MTIEEIRKKYRVGDMVCFKVGNIKDVVQIRSVAVERSKIFYIDFWFKDKRKYRDVAVEYIRHATDIEVKLGHRIDG